MKVKILFNGDPIWDQIRVEGSLRSSCWEWIGSHNGVHPICELDGRRLSAARHIWNLFCSPMLKADDHLTSCQAGNLSCVSPLHRHYYRNDLEHIERFIIRPSNPDSCTRWTGSRKYNGYPEIGINGHTRRASRVVWELHFGLIPDGLMVLHWCDRRECLNLKCLHLGTAKDNAREMIERGRGHWQKRKDESLHPAD